MENSRSASRSASSSTTARTFSRAGATDDFLQKIYPALYAKAKHTVAKPGDKIADRRPRCASSPRPARRIKTPLPGAGKPNPYCANFKPQEDNAENAQSVGSHITFGKFRVLHLGDLTVNKEFDLMCPTNRLGTVDLCVVSAPRAGHLEFGGARARDRSRASPS